MIDISWKKFEIKHPKATDAFESLCYFLFCRRFGLKDGIRTDFNQVGLETEPVKHTDGKYYGFQSKFFDKNINYTNISESISKAIANYTNLNHIIIYINQSAQTSCDSAKKIEAACKAKGISIEWYLPNNFKVALNQPNNLDLAEFYFGATNTLGILTDSKSIRMSTLLQSKEYLELNLKNDNQALSITEYGTEALNSNQKLHLITGAAGTGKSVCMRKLLYIYGSFDETSTEKQLEKVQNLGALCIYINLNNTSLESLENTVSNYKSVFFANSNNNNYIYLLDGMDEIPKSSITYTILFIENLLEKESTKKIIISSRVSSYNKYLLKASFTNLDEYTIETLEKKQVLLYFRNKGDEEKFDMLQKISDDEKIFEHLTDILTISLFWEQINGIRGKNFLTNLMQLSISTILNDAHHRKNLESLNLPNSKSESIILLNKNLALYLFENDLFNFTYGDLYKIISDAFPKCDYTSLNEIISYLSDSFFDVALTKATHTFSYQHRRFSEFFTILELEDKVKHNLNYLREQNVIVNNDLFELMLIPYLQDKAIDKKDLPLSFLIGLFNVYLGNDRAWGVEKAFYIWSDWIIYAIAALDDEILDSVINDTSLPIYKFFNEIPDRIILSLSLYEKGSFNDELRQNFKSYIALISLLHKLGKTVYSNQLILKYQEISDLCNTKKFYFNSISTKDNYLVWRSITYINTVILSEKKDNTIYTALQNSKEVNVDDLFTEYISTDVLYLSSLYYNLIIYESTSCADIVNQMNVNQLSVFAIAVSNPECICKLINNVELTSAIKKVFEPEIDSENLSAIVCLALKKILGSPLSEKEKEHARNFLNTTKFMKSSIFWKGHCDTVAMLLIAFEKEKIILKPEIAVQRYAKSYEAFLNLVSGSISIAKFVHCIQNSIYGNSEEAYYIRILLGKGFALSNESDMSIKGALDYLRTFMQNGGLLIVYHTMKLQNPNKFKRILSVTELNKLNTTKIYQDIDFTSTSESLFMLSFIISAHDSLFGYKLLLKGISNGMMRMNDRKETIGDYKLFESLEVLLQNNWLSTETLISILKRILKVAEKMNAYHIENDTHGIAMGMLRKYDFDAAEFYYRQISCLEECYNSIHFDYAMAMVQRGRNLESIENCLANITGSFDNYYQKVEWNSFYDKITVYLNIAVCDFYSTNNKNKCFNNACSEIDALEAAGWDKKLRKDEYEIYCKLCQQHSKAIDVNQEEPNLYEPAESKQEIPNILETLNKINTVDDLNDFMKKLSREYSLETFEVNELLIKKCIEITGNIDAVLEVLSKSYYPSSVFYSNNSRYFWMTVISALKNQKSQSSILEYLLKCGGGHDGFNELIKIYGFLGNKEICISAFEKMLSSIEFLLC